MVEAALPVAATNTGYGADNEHEMQHGQAFAFDDDGGV